MTVLDDSSDRGFSRSQVALSADQLKHLEFIQTIIARLGNNSFLIKGWALTLATGLFAVSVGRLSWRLAIVGLVPLLCFWYLDAFFLRQERLFRYLYDDVRRPQSTVETMSMDLRPYLALARWPDVTVSRTLLLFYGPLVAIDLTLVAVSL